MYVCINEGEMYGFFIEITSNLGQLLQKYQEDYQLILCALCKMRLITTQNIICICISVLRISEQ